MNSMKQFGAKCRPERVVHGGGEIQNNVWQGREKGCPIEVGR